MGQGTRLRPTATVKLAVGQESKVTTGTTPIILLIVPAFHQRTECGMNPCGSRPVSSGPLESYIIELPVHFQFGHGFGSLIPVFNSRPVNLDPRALRSLDWAR